MISVDLPEHDELRASVRRFLARESPIAKVVADCDLPDGHDPQLWQRLATQLGVAGLMVSEEHGGSGASAFELCIATEELGAALTGTPLIGTVALAATVLGQVADDPFCTTQLTRIAYGQARAAVIYRGANGEVDRSSLPIRALQRDGGWVLDGSARFVVEGHGADLLLVFARQDDDVALFAVDPSADGVTTHAMTTLDQTRGQAQVHLSRVPGRLLTPETHAWDVLVRSLDIATVILAAEQLGGAERVLDMAVSYAKVRTQFGRPIGSFQAIKHRCADLAVENDRARSAIAHAAWAAASPTSADRLGVAAAVAHLVCSQAFERAAQENIQIHGGIGFTWEHPAHRYFRRAKADSSLLANRSYYVDRMLGCLGIHPEDATIVLQTTP
jgi:alkylation response protein AidB-like acyl-CoA dehydrogenase